MKTEPEEVWIKQLTENISPALSEQARERALQGMAQVGARPKSRRKRLLVIATAALVALAALGFVPVPLGSAPGAWAQAIAAAEKAQTVHILGTSRRGDFDKREIWLGRKGFRYFAEWSQGKLRYFSLRDPENNLSYNYYAKARQAYENYLPKPKSGIDMSLGLGSPEGIARSLKFAEQALSERSLSEYRKRNLWGGETKIIEIVGEIKNRGTVINGPHYRAGDKVKVIIVTDAKTGHARSEREYVYKKQQWQLEYQAKYEWNVNLPGPETYRKLMVPPPGTLLTRSNWWENRANQAISITKNQDWEITLHALDINKRGEIFLSISRARRPDGRVPQKYNSGWIKVEARDNTGGNYTQASRCSVVMDHWIFSLLPNNPGKMPVPHSITMTIFPYSHDPTGKLKDEFVVLKDIPLSPRQNGDNLVVEAIKKIQY